VPQVDELRAQQKVQGKPTPEQLEELKARKARLNEVEAELAAAEAERDAALANVPNPPHESAADGMTEEDGVEIKRWGEPPKLAEPKEHTEIGRFELERAAKVSRSRFGFIVSDTALGPRCTGSRSIASAGVHDVAPSARPRGDVRLASSRPTRATTTRSRRQVISKSHPEVPLIAMHMDEISTRCRVTARSVIFRRDPRQRAATRQHVSRASSEDEMVVYTGRSRRTARAYT
jgi:hypothetical protein